MVVFYEWLLEVKLNWKLNIYVLLKKKWWVILLIVINNWSIVIIKLFFIGVCKYKYINIYFIKEL